MKMRRHHRGWGEADFKAPSMHSIDGMSAQGAAE